MPRYITHKLIYGAYLNSLYYYFKILWITYRQQLL